MSPQRPPPTEAQVAEAEALKEKGNTAFRNKKFTEALHFYTEGISLNPESQTLYSNRSATFLSLKRLPLALNDAKRAVELAPTWAKAYRRKASVLDAMRRYQEAKLMYEKALDVIPKDETLDEETRKKDETEVEAMIETLFNKINDKPKDQYSQIRSIMDVKNTPGVLILKEADRRIRAGEPMGAWPPIGSCSRRLWLAEMQFHNALIHLFEFEARPPLPGYPPDQPVISGRLQTLEELTTALVEDNRVGRFDRTAFEKLELCFKMEQYCRNAVGPNLSPVDTIAEYNRRLTHAPDASWSGPLAANGTQDGSKPTGWDYVRPALQLSIRSSLMNGMLETATWCPLFDHGVQELQRACDLIIEARKQWPEVPGGIRGRTLETTFLRQVKGYLGEALVTKYKALQQQNGKREEEWREILNKILEIGTWIVDSVKAEPKPPKQPQLLQQPNGEAVWWGVYYSHYVAPLAKAYGLIGFAHHRLAKDYEFTDFNSASGKRGPRTFEPRRLGLAAYAFARCAAWSPPDEPNRCSALWNAIMCMVERGGYFLADFECVRDMATKSPAHYTDFFPVDYVPENAAGKIVASEVVGTVVGLPPDQICSPLVSWPDGTEMDMEVAAEVLGPWTKRLVTGKGGGLLAVTDVIQQVWRQRLEDDEPNDAIGGELVWNELEPELCANWEDVWAEHLEEQMPTFTDGSDDDDDDSDRGSDDLEFTQSVVGV